MGSKNMGFQHAFQKSHMQAGIRAAHASKKTPAHLKPHLAKRMDPAEGTIPDQQEDIATQEQEQTPMAVPNKNAPVGQGGRFAAMVASGKSPALAAFIGRKKYGKKKFQGMAAKGRKSSSADAFKGR